MAVLRLARQVLFEPQFVGKESQGLPNFTQVMDSGQIDSISSPLLCCCELKACLQTSPQAHRSSLDAQIEGMGWSLGQVWIWVEIMISGLENPVNKVARMIKVALAMVTIVTVVICSCSGLDKGVYFCCWKRCAQSSQMCLCQMGRLRQRG